MHDERKQMIQHATISWATVERKRFIWFLKLLMGKVKNHWFNENIGISQNAQLLVNVLA